MSENEKYQKITPMVTNLNEKCLLHFLKTADESLYTTNATLANMLKDFGIEIKFHNPNAVYDIIDEYEYT